MNKINAKRMMGMKNVENQVSVRSIIFTTIGFIIMLAVFKYMWMIWQQPEHVIEVKKGEITLSEEQVNLPQALHLDGEWDFFPNELLNPDEISKRLAFPIDVPDNWHSSLSFGGKKEATEIGTYHLHITLPKPDQNIYAFYFNDLYTSANIFVNGELKRSIGTVSEEAQEYVGKTTSEYVSFDPDSTDIHLVIQVANHELPGYGGILKSVKFGTHETIIQFAYRYEMIQFVAAAIYFLHLLYGFSLFFMGQRGKELVYYLLFSLSAITATIFDGSQMALNILSLNLEGAIKIKVIAYLGITIFGLLFFKTLYPKYFKRRATRVILAINYALIFVTIPIPIHYAIVNLLASSIMMTITFSYIAYVNVKSRFYNEKYYRVLIFTTVSLVFGTVWNIAYNFSNLKVAYYPYEIVFVFMGLTIFLFKRSMIHTEQTIKLSRELHQLNELKNVFIASITRELRNPIQAIMNMTNRMTTNKEEKEQLHLITLASRHMEITLNNLVDISRIHGKEFVLMRKSVDIHMITNAVVPIFTFRNIQNITIESKVPSSFPAIYADETRITQILFILIQNALQYTEEGKVTVSASITDTFANISIKDTGVGISKTFKDRIFNPYTDHPNRVGSRNAGVDLSLCKTLVQLHGGKITVDSVEGKGTVFTFTMPLYDMRKGTKVVSDDHEEMILPTLHDTVSARTIEQTQVGDFSEVAEGARILMIDYDHLNTEVLYNILSEDYDVTIVYNAHVALQKIKQESYDLIISEIMMPQMSGLELTRQIRKQYTTYELPIILVTAGNLVNEKYTAFTIGANDFIVKPVDAIELKSRIYSFVMLKRSIKERLNMEAAWLQAQIRPHFLFNTLGTIISLSYSDQKAMIKLLNGFSDYLRMSFKPTNTDSVVPLDEELELIYAYLQIEKFRFADRINIMFAVDQTDDLFIPPLALQTIVENALNHGILAKPEGGTLFVALEHHKSHAKLIVQDNGVGMDERQITHLLEQQGVGHKGIGISNTHARLKRQFGKGLEITSVIGEGTTITMYLPYETTKK